ncbi:hypothetical protein [Pseudomonas syringae group genomosp. 3]|uniref:hypothetical protein n=1 Tax=Pseudomonas syringae group genomosp. 3 TaxID=251701 RepID=UPI001604D6A9|nr:hypothetical protein [Pseudomonas syringae group genomosp. 3]
MTVFSFRKTVAAFACIFCIWLAFGSAISKAEEFSYWDAGNGSVSFFSKPWQGCDYIFYVRSPWLAPIYNPYFNRNMPW